MGTPIAVDLPHQLGLAGAKARLDQGVGQLGQRIPGGATVNHHWEGDTMHFTVAAMGQTVASRVTAYPNHVHAEVDLPAFLGLFAGVIKGAIESEGPKLLR